MIEVKATFKGSPNNLGHFSIIGISNKTESKILAQANVLEVIWTVETDSKDYAISRSKLCIDVMEMAKWGVELVNVIVD